MRLAVLAHSFPRFPGDTNGPFVKDLSEALAARGHQVWALVPWDPELIADPRSALRIESFRYVWPRRWHLLGYSRTLHQDVRLKPWAYLQAPLYLACASRALRRLVERERIELVHAHWILPNGYVASRVAAATGVPYAVTLHGSDVFMAERNPLFAAMARRALAGAAHVTSCSADLRERLLAVGGAHHADKVLLVPNGTALAPRVALAPGDSAERKVVAVGRMVPKKGFGELLEAAPRILERFPDARIVLGGGGDLLARLAARAEQLGVGDRVLFPGPLSHHQALELIATAAVFVMPSVRDPSGNVDGLPIVVLEAMAAGKPVVASAVSGLPLAVDDGRTGRLVPERDPAALADAVCELLADPERAARMGAEGRRRIERELHWGAVAGRHEDLCRAALVGTPRALRPSA
ncbi:MAG TPA: glycosyltransferase family 4 protein [Thermoanaerobaculia bacterium]|nr:glycosyltransferase family 4 protein [Thermoanaerobaculia bacterium]